MGATLAPAFVVSLTVPLDHLEDEAMVYRFPALCSAMRDAESVPDVRVLRTEFVAADGASPVLLKSGWATSSGRPSHPAGFQLLSGRESVGADSVVAQARLMRAWAWAGVSAWRVRARASLRTSLTGTPTASPGGSMSAV